MTVREICEEGVDVMTGVVYSGDILTKQRKTKNPIGKENMEAYWNNFCKHYKEENA